MIILMLKFKRIACNTCGLWEVFDRFWERLRHFVEATCPKWSRHLSGVLRFALGYYRVVTPLKQLAFCTSHTSDRSLRLLVLFLLRWCHD